MNLTSLMLYIQENMTWIGLGLITFGGLIAIILAIRSERNEKRINK